MAGNFELLSPHSYILMKDTQGEKAAGKIMTVFGSGSKPFQVLRGELLTLIPFKELKPRSGGKPAHRFCLKKDLSVTLLTYGAQDDPDVAPLGTLDTELLEAIPTVYERFATFCEELKLEWGGKLKTGDQVYVKMPSPNSSTPDWSIAVIQYVGEVEFLSGRNFGVEIKVSQHLSRR